jgi:putative hydrolase of the HAD superfamily
VNSPNQSANQTPAQSLRHAPNQTLLIDADDTLWENNIYFERAITSFISYLDHRVHTPEEVRSHLNGVEHATVLSHGYGLHSFRRSLVTCFEQLTDAPLTRHRLILVTKGNPEEQTGKLQRSGLAPHFTAVEVLPEKHHDAYVSLTTHHGCEAPNTWMIGNSPRSDINPALSAGLNAIFIPHDFTWVLEHEVVNQPPAGQHLLELAAFADLASYF